MRGLSSELDITQEEYEMIVKEARERHRSREFIPGKDTCRICGKVITSSERFYRDEPQGKESSDTYLNRWVHRECLHKEIFSL